MQNCYDVLQNVNCDVYITSCSRYSSTLGMITYSSLLVYYVCFQICIVMVISLQYHRYIEIAIKQCRSSGIDCKVHGLSIVGRIRAEDEDLATVPFLASDNEEEDEEKAAVGR